MKKYLFISDPGHGWLRVPLKEILPIQDKISKCSYMNSKFAYLEEDCDMSIFLKYKYPDISSLNEISIYKYSKNTKVRSLDRFSTISTDDIGKWRLIKKYLMERFDKKSFNKINQATPSQLVYWKEYYNISI
jgi:hypothetical protein